MSKPASIVGLVLALTFVGCSSGPSSSSGTTTPTTLVGQRPTFDPPLPPAANPMPYVMSATVGAGTWKFRVIDTEISAPTANAARELKVEVWIENGTFDAQTIKPEAFAVYDDALRGVAATQLDGQAELAGAASRTVTLSFELAESAVPQLLVFRGSETYGGPTQDSIVSLDPDFVPQAPA